MISVKRRTAAKCLTIYLRYRRWWTWPSGPARCCSCWNFPSLFWSSCCQTSQTWTWSGEKTCQLLSLRPGPLWCHVWELAWPWCLEVSTQLSLSPVRPPGSPRYRDTLWFIVKSGGPGLSPLSSQVSGLRSEDHNYSLITQTARSGQNLVRTLVRDQLHCSTNIAHLAWWEHNTHYCFSSLFWTQTGLGQDLSSTICVLWRCVTLTHSN